MKYASVPFNQNKNGWLKENLALNAYPTLNKDIDADWVVHWDQERAAEKLGVSVRSYKRYEALKILDSRVTLLIEIPNHQGKNDKGEDYWHVYFAKPTKNAKQTAKYLGRYLKKPSAAGSRLANYDGGSRVSLRFLDHRTGRYDNLELSQRELILRIAKHIPEKHFRMIRYFGFLANR